MRKFDSTKKAGIRDWVTMKVIAVYPYAPLATDEETENAVRDWFYAQDCDAENLLRTSFVDVLTDEEAAELKPGLVDTDV